MGENTGGKFQSYRKPVHSSAVGDCHLVSSCGTRFFSDWIIWRYVGIPKAHKHTQKVPLAYNKDKRKQTTVAANFTWGHVDVVLLCKQSGRTESHEAGKVWLTTVIGSYFQRWATALKADQRGRRWRFLYKEKKYLHLLEEKDVMLTCHEQLLIASKHSNQQQSGFSKEEVLWICWSYEVSLNKLRVSSSILLVLCDGNVMSSIHESYWCLFLLAWSQHMALPPACWHCLVNLNSRWWTLKK